MEPASRRETSRDIQDVCIQSRVPSIFRSVTELTDRGPRGECFCRVVPRKGQRQNGLETFSTVMRARYPSIEARSDIEEAFRHVLSSVCGQTVVDDSNTLIQTPPSNGRGEECQNTMKEMIQCHKESVNTLGIKFSVVHPFSALLVLHSDWLPNHLVRAQ